MPRVSQPRQTAPPSDALQTSNLAPNNVPYPLTRFVGREHEIRELRELLASARLITLTGPGGCGKTRLALELADRLKRDGGLELCWVELAALNDPALVPQQVATALGLFKPGNRPATERLVPFLSTRPLVLILDNCDHLTDACAHLAYSLLSQCANLKIVATSQQPLQVEGEINWLVPPLNVPPPEQWTDLRALEKSEAIPLFVERARAVSPRFTLTRQNALAVAEICYQLDGMPMAIELAAARIQVLSPEQIASRLDDRFTLLVGSTRTGQPRHQTLRATMDWSYDLLSERERDLLCRLSVFVDGWTLEAAEDVCTGDAIQRADVLGLLSQLVTKSLVEVTDEGARYRMLGTIRQYALEKAVASESTQQTRDNHLDYFGKFVSEADPKLRSAEQLIWFDRIDREHNNLRAALEWALETNSDVALRLVSDLFFFWFVRGFAREAIGWTERALARPAGADSVARARALTSLGVFLWGLGENEKSVVQLRAALDLYHHLSDRVGSAYVKNLLGVSYYGTGDLEAAIPLWESSLSVKRETGDPWAIAQTLQNFTEIARSKSDWHQLEQVATETVELFRAAGDQRGVGRSLGDVAYAAQRMGNYERAAEIFIQALTSVWQVRDRGSFAQLLQELAAVMVLRGRPEAAARLGGAANALREAIGFPLLPSDGAEYRETLDTIQSQLGTERFETAWQEGRQMSPDRSLAYANESSLAPDFKNPPPDIKPTRAQTNKKFGGLTARERQVAALVAQGKSNRAIADELVVTERTIEKHVENILLKLGFHSRSLIAAWAVDRGLASPPP